ncbi:NHL domain protein [Trema orientale]|uniref:NHL domain protein n=1 Tax=Trema orientale TaxID=63057 RepID=A0A2P5BTB0_TREOI|nr:NHL domain protein [Trema orientale]
MTSDLTADVSPREEMGLISDDVSELMFARRGCCYSWIPCFGSDRSSASGSVWWQRMRPAENDDPWWSRGWKKVREWSEIVAGPKWKTFIRRFNKNRSHSGYRQTAKFNYDEFSYALNFDEGPGQNGHFDDDEEDILGRDFSSRFASVPASAKSSMDLGKEGGGGGPSFT